MPPVEDHPVHPLTVKKDRRYIACQNKPLRDDLIYVALAYDRGIIKSSVSSTCRYDMFETDPGCEGCKQPKDWEYLQRMGVLKEE